MAKATRMSDEDRAVFSEISAKAKAFQAEHNCAGRWNRRIHCGFLIQWLRSEGIEIPPGEPAKRLHAKLQLSGLGDNSSQFGAAAGLRDGAAELDIE